MSGPYPSYHFVKMQSARAQLQKLMPKACPRLPDDPIWQDPLVQEHSDCLSFALDHAAAEPRTQGAFNADKLKILSLREAKIYLANAAMELGMQRSASELFGGDVMQWRHGYYLVALFLLHDNQDNRGFHFYRRDEVSGQWWHKDSTGPVKNIDASGSIIIDPRKADRRIQRDYLFGGPSQGFEHLVGFFYVPSGGLLSFISETRPSVPPKKPRRFSIGAMINRALRAVREY